MPLYEYECPLGHRFDVFELSWRNLKDSLPCRFKLSAELPSTTSNEISDISQTCDEIAIHVIRSLHGHRHSFDAQSTAPSIIYRKIGTTDDYWFTGSKNTTIPKGYEKIELRNSIERTNFENAINSKQREEYQIKTEMYRQELANSRKKRDEQTYVDLPIPDGRGNIIGYKRIHQNDFDGKTRELLAKSRERRSEQDKKIKDKMKEPNFHIDVNHNDYSNREGYRDKETGWRERKS